MSSNFYIPKEIGQWKAAGLTKGQQLSSDLVETDVPVLGGCENINDGLEEFWLKRVGGSKQVYESFQNMTHCMGDGVLQGD